jgi:hypothetical protein
MGFLDLVGLRHRVVGGSWVIYVLRGNYILMGRRIFILIFLLVLGGFDGGLGIGLMGWLLFLVMLDLGIRGCMLGSYIMEKFGRMWYIPPRRSYYVLKFVELMVVGME